MSNNIIRKEKHRIKLAIYTALATKNYTMNRLEGVIHIKIPKKKGAPYGNKNALGNKGGKGGLFGNTNAQKHGFYSNGIYRLFMYDYCQRVMELEKYELLDRESLRIATDIIQQRVKIEIYPLMNIDNLIAFVASQVE